MSRRPDAWRGPAARRMARPVVRLVELPMFITVEAERSPAAPGPWCVSAGPSMALAEAFARHVATPSCLVHLLLWRATRTACSTVGSALCLAELDVGHPWSRSPGNMSTFGPTHTTPPRQSCCCCDTCMPTSARGVCLTSSEQPRAGSLAIGGHRVCAITALGATRTRPESRAASGPREQRRLSKR